MNRVSSVGIAMKSLPTAGMSPANVGILLSALDAHAIVSISNINGEIIEVNDHFCRVSGYRRDELIGQNHRLLKSGTHRPEFYDALWRTISSGLCWSGEICNRSKDGRLYWVSTTIVPFLDDAGLPSCYVSIRTEITELKHLANSLKTSDERFRRSQEYANIGTWDWDINTGEVYWSEQIAPLFGYEGIVETTYQNFLNAVHPDDRAAVVNAINSSINDGTPYKIEHRCVWPNGTVRWLLEQGAVTRNLQGTPLRMLGVVQDITDEVMQRKALEEARILADAANHAKSEFLSRMSHELRTPLNSILGFAQLLQIAGKLDVSGEENVDHILRAGQHLLALIDDVLDLARIEAGKLRLTIEPFHLRSVIDDAIAMTRGLAHKREVRIHVHEVPDSAQAMGDRLRLRQVLVNLLSNAIKYNGKGGEVHLRVALLDNKDTKDPDRKTHWQISVADTGQGIDPARLGELFQPFTRLVDENSEIDGTGIGLSLSRNLIESMGGQIHVTSTIGVGSEFSVSVPAATGSEAAQVSAALASTTSAKLELPATEITVLYVEDNLANTQLIRDVFAMRPHWRLLTAHSGPLGLDMAKLRQPDLLLIDIDLPGMSGFTLLEALQADALTKDIPAIAVTATVFAQAEEHYLKAGFAAYLPKPINVTRLLELTEALARSRTQTQRKAHG